MVPKIDDPNALPLRTILVMCVQAAVVARTLANSGDRQAAGKLARVVTSVSDGLGNPQDLLNAVDGATKILEARKIQVDSKEVARASKAADMAMNMVEEWVGLALSNIRRRVHEERGRKSA